MLHQEQLVWGGQEFSRDLHHLLHCKQVKVLDEEDGIKMTLNTKFNMFKNQVNGLFFTQHTRYFTVNDSQFI